MTETIREVATVADLHIGHIGKRVTVASPAGSVSGKLVCINAEAAVMQLADYGDINAVSPGDVLLGVTSVTLTIGRAVVPVRLDARAELT